MTDREKLIEIIMTSEILCHDCGENSASYCAEALADHLLANGVTVQGWIPVTERLPEVGEKVRVIDGVTGEVTTARLNDFNCFVFSDGRGHRASHWKP